MMSMMTFRLDSRSRPLAFRRGFSLVEVTLAMGILAFSMLTVLGLMPVGLSTMRRAMDSTVETQIVRQIGGEVLLTPYSRLGDIVGAAPRCFDDNGQEQESETAATRFWVTLLRPDSVYPGSTNANALTSSLSAIQVRVVRGPSASVRKDTNTYNFSIPNSGN